MKFRIFIGMMIAVIPSVSGRIPEITTEIQALMGGTEEAPVVVRKRPTEPHTSFHTQTGYLPQYDIRTDAVIIYDTAKEKYDSWKAHGYDTQTMYCFRADREYLSRHPGSGQANVKGEILKVGEEKCYYMVPTAERITTAVSYFETAIDNGSSAVVPEEPEYFAEAGYSPAFKQAWQEYYGEPWRDPASSLEARWQSEALKAAMELRMVEAILDGAQARNPAVKCMVAIHSPLHYVSSGIVFPYYRMLRETPLQELIAQIWTGTARVPTLLDGNEAERTFEWSYLEYSSLDNFLRGTGKRLWFFMDPLEDNLDRGIGDYQENYEKTLIASLMFPEVDEYEVMPWPTRIYGHVPDWFATKVGTIVNVLNDMHAQKGHEFLGGTRAIATFVADSMGWQRGEPFPSDLSGFHALTLPLLTKGIPVQVAQLERVTEKDYLAPYKILLLSYDFLKPMTPSINKALAEWVGNGGTLILFGGTDPYNNLKEWWTKAGYVSPQDHLLFELGVKMRRGSGGDSGMLAQPLHGTLAASFQTATPPTARIPITTYQTEAPPLLSNFAGDAICFEQKVGGGTLLFVELRRSILPIPRMARD